MNLKYDKKLVESEGKSGREQLKNDKKCKKLTKKQMTIDLNHERNPRKSSEIE